MFLIKLFFVLFLSAAASGHSSSDFATTALLDKERTLGAPAHCTGAPCIELFQPGDDVS